MGIETKLIAILGGALTAIIAFISIYFKGKSAGRKRVIQDIDSQELVNVLKQNKKQAEVRRAYDELRDVVNSMPEGSGEASGKHTDMQLDRE